MVDIWGKTWAKFEDNSDKARQAGGERHRPYLVVWQYYPSPLLRPFFYSTTETFICGVRRRRCIAANSGGTAAQSSSGSPPMKFFVRVYVLSLPHAIILYVFIHLIVSI